MKNNICRKPILSFIFTFLLLVFTIDGHLALSDDSFDLSKTVLSVTKDAYKDLYNTDIDVDKYMQHINEIADILSKRIDTQKEPENIIKTLNQYFYEEMSISYISRFNNGIAIFPTFVLEEKQGDCIGISMLYLAVAERMGIPLYGVQIPGHVFVRYVDNGKRINIETSRKGESLSDDVYIKRYRLANMASFFENRTEKQMIAVYLADIGTEYIESKMFDKAISIHKTALTFDANSSLNLGRLGICYAMKGMMNEAISEQKKAIALNVEDDVAYGNLGQLYFEKGKLNDAIPECRKAIERNFSNCQAHNTLGISYMGRRLLDDAISEFKTCIDLEEKASCLPSMGKRGRALVHKNLAKAYARKDMWDKVGGEIQKALDLDPKCCDDILVKQ